MTVNNDRELFKIIDYDTGEDRIFCSYQCADDFVCVNDLPQGDILPLDIKNEDDKIYIEENIGSKCDMCKRGIK